MSEVSHPFRVYEVDYAKIHSNKFESSCHGLHKAILAKRRVGKLDQPLIYSFSPCCYWYLNEYGSQELLRSKLPSVLGSQEEAYAYYKQQFDNLFLNNPVYGLKMVEFERVADYDYKAILSF